MNGGDGVYTLFAIQFGLFAVWTMLAFGMLFYLYRDAVSKTQSCFPGLRAVLDAIGSSFHKPQYANIWLSLYILTVALLAIAAFIPQVMDV